MQRQNPPTGPSTEAASALFSCLWAILASLAIAGCGQTGAPLPPSLKLPNPVADLTASRAASQVHLKWTMPRRTTDKLPLAGPQRVQICRRISDGACQTIATVSFPPEKPASFEDTLPADLTAGPPQLLAYSVDVLSPHGRSAGSSNIVYSATGPAPPPFTAPQARVTADGVVLEWRPNSLEGPENKVDIERELLSAPGKTVGRPPAKSRLGGLAAAPAREQTLVVRMPPGTDSGRALDPGAAFDQRYSYRLCRIATVAIAGKSIEVRGSSSPEIVVDTRDTFPPATPSGLAAVAAPDEGAIDLSWSPNSEPDLAGYAVYRAEPGHVSTRISPPGKPLATPAFRDSTAQPGRVYAYSVSAIDRDGNESSRSAEIRESLPAKP